MLDIAEKLIDRYHPHLKEARIAFLFRSEAPVSNGKATLGKASKVSAQWKPLLQDEFDFIIWLAHDRWEHLDPKQRKALVDHELCHCGMDRGEPYMIAHDIEEFAVIISRWGEWKPDLQEVGRAFRQEPLLDLPPRQGKLVAVDLPASRQVFEEAAEQMSDMFDDVEVEIAFGVE